MTADMGRTIDGWVARMRPMFAELGEELARFMTSLAADADRADRRHHLRSAYGQRRQARRPR